MIDPAAPGSPTPEIIEVGDQHYILASSTRDDEQPRVLKHDDLFAVLDRLGHITPIGLGQQGLYYDDTRFLSLYTLRLGADRPLLLSSTVRDDNAAIAIDATNPDVSDGGRVTIPHGTLHVSRRLFLWDRTYFERLTVRNYGLTPVSTDILITFDADYADIFEVRGTRRAARGRRHRPNVRSRSVTFSYDGLDDVTRVTRIAIDPAPAACTRSSARLAFDLEAGAERHYDVAIACSKEPTPASRISLPVGLSRAAAHRRIQRRAWCGIETSNGQANGWLARSQADLSMLTSALPTGDYPSAGVPWFSVPFGRDGLITAYACLWVNPALARGVLGFLAATQADAYDPVRDAQPGKILHEWRASEMAATGEVPFGRYYGSHDATPLFVMLAAAYYGRTADRALVETLWPNLERALAWLAGDADPDGDGFIEYARQSPHGLVHQGWKDSHNAVFHANGALAEAPIALVEHQGYAFAAWTAGARLARLVGRDDLAGDWTDRAERLRERFEAAFWIDALDTYALALDGGKRPCDVRTSNAGHALWTGIASADRAARVARALMQSDSFSGWGIRTVSTLERRYNPMSYHNGSVWPHDNALVAAGFARYGLQAQVAELFGALFDASIQFELQRLPELFCGLARHSGESPTHYPVACSPQAWAAAAPFLLLQSSLGLTIDATHHRVHFHRAHLPAFLPEVRLRDLTVGRGTVDLVLTRHAETVGINVARRSGPIEVTAIT